MTSSHPAQPAHSQESSPATLAIQAPTPESAFPEADGSHREALPLATSTERARRPGRSAPAMPRYQNPESRIDRTPEPSPSATQDRAVPAPPDRRARPHDAAGRDSSA